MKQADNDDDKSDLSNIQKNTGIALNNHQNISDRLVIYNRYKELEQFFNEFRDKLVLVDPLDREILGSGEENQATPVNELVKMVDAMPTIQGTNLFVPLSDDKYQRLMDMFQRENLKVAEEGSRFIDLIKKSKQFDKDFSKNKLVQNLRDTI